MRTLDFYRATTKALPDTTTVLRCPYHSQWVRFKESYRTCPTCFYCVRCRLHGRPVYFAHTHGRRL